MEVANNALTSITDFTDAQQQHHRRGLPPQHWNPPDLGHWKLNVDGTLFLDHSRAGLDYVLQNEQGQVQVAATKPEFHFTEPLEVELLAIFCGMQLCASLGPLDLLVETNCLLAVEDLTGSSNPYALYNTLILEILRLKKLFWTCIFQYVNRIGNQVAHSLTIHTWLVETTTVWWDSVPHFATSALWPDTMLYVSNYSLNEISYYQKK